MLILTATVYHKTWYYNPRLTDEDTEADSSYVT